MRAALRRARDRRRRQRWAAPRLLRAFAAAHPEACFAEIGANDGLQHDHLREHILRCRWRGVMVEPVPHVFARLAENYGHLDRIALANVAVADRDGTLPFFHLAPVDDPSAAGLPGWYDGIGSFSRDAVLRHRRDIPDIEARLVRTEVPCLTFSSLCARHGIDALDLLVIDAEGYDGEIVTRLPFTEHRPRLLGYEHFHLSPEDRAATRQTVRDAGYEVLEEGFDTWCLAPDRAAEPVRRLWRRLEPRVPAVVASDEAR